MNLAHVCYAWRPDPVGGTEVYAESLARALTARGHRVCVLAPGRSAETEEAEGYEVFRYPTLDGASLEQIYGQDDPVAAEWFERWIAGRALDVVHFHASTGAQPLRMIRAARRVAPVVLTYHTPTVTCPRGTMMIGGRRPCDGRIDEIRCGACLLESRGLPPWIAACAAAIPRGLSRRLARRLSGRMALAAGVRHHVRLRREATLERLALADRIVSPCGWVDGVLAANGVDAGKIVRFGQGADPPPASATAARPRESRALRVGWFGRVCAEKAPDLLLDAILSLPSSVPVICEFHGVVQSEAERGLWDRLRERASADSRLVFLQGSAEARRQMGRYDVVAVPGRWLETGPLVLLEAFAAGVPVMGADLGGIRERIRDGVDGWLVPHASARAWAEALRRLAEDPSLVRRAASQVRPPQTTSTVAAGMEQVYREIRR